MNRRWFYGSESDCLEGDLQAQHNFVLPAVTRLWNYPSSFSKPVAPSGEPRRRQDPGPQSCQQRHQLIDYGHEKPQPPRFAISTTNNTLTALALAAESAYTYIYFAFGSFPLLVLQTKSEGRLAEVAEESLSWLYMAKMVTGLPASISQTWKIGRLIFSSGPVSSKSTALLTAFLGCYETTTLWIRATERTACSST